MRAGPTGLTVACDLLATGVDARVIDGATGPATTSRALGLQPRGVEVLERAGALGAVYAGSRDVLLARTRLILTTPALRAHMADNQFATERLFTEALAARGSAAITLELRVQAAAALAALTVALTVWVHSDGADSLPDLVDRAFSALGSA